MIKEKLLDGAQGESVEIKIFVYIESVLSIVQYPQTHIQPCHQSQRWHCILGTGFYHAWVRYIGSSKMGRLNIRGSHPFCFCRLGASLFYPLLAHP
jgi:hypothetical protein